MEEIIKVVLENLKNVGLGCALFVIAYSSNILFSLWYNIKICNENFEPKKLLDSIIKILAFGLGTSLLVIDITLIPIFTDYVGLTIPEEYVEVFQNLAIIAIFMISSYRYILEAYGKFKKILGNPDE